MILETPRLILDTWQPSDWSALRPIAADVEVMRYITGGVPWTDAEVQDYVARQMKFYSELGFCRWKLLAKPRAAEQAAVPSAAHVPPAPPRQLPLRPIPAESIAQGAGSTSPRPAPRPAASREAAPAEVAGEIIGFCGVAFWRDSPDPDIGWWLARSYWGRGLATEAARAALADAFERVGLNRIVAIARPANTPSIRIMQKLGLTFECDFESEGVLLVRYAIERVRATP